MEANVALLVQTAQTLAAIQIEGVEDATGFSNADKHLGAFLASVVLANPECDENVRALASVVAKYKRQVEGLTSPEFYTKVRALAKDATITPEQREKAKKTIIAQAGLHPRFGPQVCLSFPYSQSYVYTVKEHGAKGFRDGDGFHWALTPAKVAGCLAALQAQGATVVGSYDIPSEAVKQFEAEARKVGAALEGRFVRLTFRYDAELVAAVKTLPARKYDADTKSWSFPVTDLALAIEAFNGLDVDLSALHEIIAQAPALAQPAPEEKIGTISDDILRRAFLHQKDGMIFMSRPIGDVRREIAGGAQVRGFILGDDMGLGKTFQLIATADAINREGGRTLIVCPATLKRNWAKEIVEWLGPDAKVSIVETETIPYKVTFDVLSDGKYVPKEFKGAEPVSLGIDPDAQFVITNYDTLGRDYALLVAMGFDILILDEAHYIKNRDSNRSKLVVGGTVAMRQVPTANDPADSKRRKISGLANEATKRVFAATGTPLMNKPKDLFNLLRAVGHPLGRNFVDFGRRYCDPIEQFGKYGRKFGTTYEGASNVRDLRAKINPIFLQRKKDDVLDLPGKVRAWTPVEVSLIAYKAKMEEYAARRAAGELSSAEHHLALLNEARLCVAVSKVAATIELVENAVEQGEKVIVFTNFTEPLNAIAAAFGASAVTLSGISTQDERNAAVDRFQTDATCKVFVANLKAGGVGINLTAATQVIVNDLDWTPANHLQAEDRAYRIGQKQMVNVTYVLAAGTFDEDMAVLLEEKFDVINAFELMPMTSLFNDLLTRLQVAPRNEAVRGIGRRSAA